MSNEATSVDAVDLANELRPVVLKITRELRRELHAIGVSASQVSLLVQIRAKSGIGISELAERERMSVPGMSGHVERLVKAGLVERPRAESGDRRRVGLKVTPEGHSVLRSVRSRRTAWLASRLRGLEPGELERIEAAIKPLSKLLGDAA